MFISVASANKKAKVLSCVSFAEVGEESLSAITANIGERFGRWVVLEIVDCGHRKCRCDCGTEKTVLRQTLTQAKGKSCGCLRKERTAERSTKHGGAAGRVPTYYVWKGMRRRCQNPNAQDYKYYGGRGISICDRWRDSFENFLADMGARPGAEFSIERKDNEGPYSPSNCVWATRIQQMNNRRNNRLVEFDGETMTVAEWASRIGMSRSCLYNRLYQLKWSVSKSLNMGKK